MDSPPDAVVLEMAPGSGDVMDAIGRCHAAHPDTALVVISQTKDGELAERAIKAGVRAFVYKGVGARSLAEAIRDACRGVLHVCRCIASPMLQKTLYGNGGHKAKHPDLARLSSREFQVFQLLGNGWDNGRIARNLGISVKTLNAHQEHLKQKLAQTSTRELRTYAAAWQSQSGN
jgi:DNA-binding NarL/FixJ family response regulator